MKYPKNIQKFLNTILKNCEKSGVKVRLVNTPSIKLNNIFVSGYFDDQDKEIAVATKAPLAQWLGVLIHEYSHFLQWKENCKAWRDIENSTIADCVSLVDMWLDKSIELTSKQKQEYFNKVIAMELDCEKRAVRLIKTYKLPINISEYIQKANSYLASYQAIAVTRKWTKQGKAAYKFDEIWTKMPKNFTYPYFKRLSPIQVDKKFGICFK